MPLCWAMTGTPYIRQLPRYTERAHSPTHCNPCFLRGRTWLYNEINVGGWWCCSHLFGVDFLHLPFTVYTINSWYIYATPTPAAHTPNLCNTRFLRWCAWLNNEILVRSVVRIYMDHGVDEFVHLFTVYTRFHFIFLFAYRQCPGHYLFRTKKLTQLVEDH